MRTARPMLGRTIQQNWPRKLVAGSPSDHNMPHHFHCHHLPSERARITSKFCSNGGSHSSSLPQNLPADPLPPQDTHCYVR